jgi:CRP/FNR family transcriptional regulator, cyclic AMP receptor protein
MGDKEENEKCFTDESLLELLAKKGAKRSYKSGAFLISEGDLGDEIFIILSGQVRAFSKEFKGKEITHGVYGPGQYVGEMSLDGGRRSANVEASQLTTCSVITRETLRLFIKDNPDFAFELIRNLILRIRIATESSTALALSTVYARLASFLQNRASADPNNFGVIEEILSHSKIANHVGCSREMVSRLIKDLESGGYLTTEKKRYRLLKVLPKNW